MGGLPTMLSVNRPAPSMDRSADLDEASEESEEESDDDLSDVDQGANDKAGTAQS